MAQGYEDASGTPDEVLERVRDNWQSAKDWLEPYHREAEELYTFLYKFDHYEDSPKVTERDRRRAKPAGRQSASKHRHKLARVLKQSLYITTRGVDLDTDPDTAENVRWFMEYEVHDPQKRFRRVLRRACSLMLSTGMGAITLEVRDDLGDYPEIRPKLLPADRLGWTPGWNDPDDDTCPWVTMEFDELVSEIERRGKAEGRFKWQNTEGLTGDTTADALRGRSLPSDRPLRAAGAAYPGEPTTADRVKVVYCWYRHDHGTKRDETTYTLEQSARYMACPTCPHRDYSQPGDMLPEQGAMCPECAAMGQQSMMGRVDREKIPPGRYSKGRRLVIIAPNQNRVFYDDDWPYSVNGMPMRNVPVALLKGYDLPLEPGASCDTIWDFSYQVIANATDRRIYEWISRAGGVLVAGMDGLMNANGSAPFEFTDRPISLARWKGMGQPAVEYFQPHGMIAELLPFVNYWNGQFRSDMGLFDSSSVTAPGRSKDIAVGTMRALEQSGEIPVDDHAEQVRESMSALFGVWYDMKRAIMTERQIVRLRGPEGIDMLAKMRGEELPNVDVIVGSGPNWDEFDGERVKQLRELLAIPPGMDPMAWMRLMPVLARNANIPMETVREIQKAMQPPAPPAGPPAGEGVPNASQPGMNGGPPGTGIPPAIAARMAGMGGMSPAA